MNKTEITISLIAAVTLASFNLQSAFALTAASLTLSDPRTSETGVSYTFNAASFDTGTNINCISLDFNDAANGGGSIPTGIDTTGASLDTGGTLITESNWTESFGTNGSLDLTFVGGEAPASSGTLIFTGIQNGSTESAYFAILSTYTNTDCSTGLTDQVVVAYAYKDGHPVAVTIAPVLTFSCVGVAAGSVNGETITHDSSGATIDYSTDVNASTNGISAHDLQVSSNAASGYTVSIRHTGLLTNGTSDTIDSHTGTNLSPSTMSTGVEGWGYTTEDSTLSAIGDGADRFTNPGNEWAGFTTSNEEVVFNSVSPVGTETTRVGHQVSIDTNTETGTYTTTIIYTVVGVF